MDFAIRRDDPKGPYQNATVVEDPFRSQFQQAKDHVHAAILAYLSNRFGGRAGNRLSVLSGLLKARKTVPAEHALGEDYQISPLDILML
jgi:hypothetical protein